MFTVYRGIKRAYLKMFFEIFWSARKKFNLLSTLQVYTLFYEFGNFEQQGRNIFRDVEITIITLFVKFTGNIIFKNEIQYKERGMLGYGNLDLK